MYNPISQLSKAVLKKDSLAECTRDQLQELTEKYPYFAAAQLLLTGKLKETGDDLFDEQLQKTSLYINNPFWLDLLINPKDFVQENFELQEKDAIEDENEMEPEEMESSSEVIFNIKLPDFNTPVAADAELPMSFEPYHLVDYFASQGIKIESEILNEDKLGKKLKSFTDWLKLMKKLPETDKLNTFDSGSELKVIALAQHSLEAREIVTESMAAVWEKQGNAIKAIETYEKLSLLDPAKFTYFATKIEHLKKY